MAASIALIIGIFVAVLLLSSRGGAPPTAAHAWWTLALGLIAAAALIAGLAASPRPDDTGFILNLTSIAFSAAAVVVGLVGLRRGQRRWPNWTGLAAGLAVAIFWTAFALGYVLEAVR